MLAFRSLWREALDRSCEKQHLRMIILDIQNHFLFKTTRSFSNEVSMDNVVVVEGNSETNSG